MSHLASLGGPRAALAVMPDWPLFGDADRTTLVDVLDSGSWYTGDRVREFEESFATYQNATYGVACTGGTVALEAIIRASGIGVGDEIITSPYTFIGTCSAILKTGAAIRFVDVDPYTSNLDIDEIENAITSSTRAIMPVHFGGLACDIDRLIDAIRNSERSQDKSATWQATKPR